MKLILESNYIKAYPSVYKNKSTRVQWEILYLTAPFFNNNSTVSL